jgi:hypothetical protein
MIPNDPNSYREYLDAHIRMARMERDEAMAQMILAAAESLARYAAKVTHAFRPVKGGHARRSHA